MNAARRKKIEALVSELEGLIILRNPILDMLDFMCAVDARYKAEESFGKQTMLEQENKPKIDREKIDRAVVEVCQIRRDTPLRLRIKRVDGLMEEMKAKHDMTDPEFGCFILEAVAALLSENRKEKRTTNLRTLAGMSIPDAVTLAQTKITDGSTFETIDIDKATRSAPLVLHNFELRDILGDSVIGCGTREELENVLKEAHAGGHISPGPLGLMMVEIDNSNPEDQKIHTWTVKSYRGGLIILRNPILDMLDFMCAVDARYKAEESFGKRPAGSKAH